MNWFPEGLLFAPKEMRPKQAATHVDATFQGSQDGGSIPPASITNGHLQITQVAIFIGLAVIHK